MVERKAEKGALSLQRILQQQEKVGDIAEQREPNAKSGARQHIAGKVDSGEYAGEGGADRTDDAQHG